MQAVPPTGRQLRNAPTERDERLPMRRHRAPLAPERPRRTGKTASERRALHPEHLQACRWASRRRCILCNERRSGRPSPRLGETCRRTLQPVKKKEPRGVGAAGLGARSPLEDQFMIIVTSSPSVEEMPPIAPGSTTIHCERAVAPARNGKRGIGIPMEPNPAPAIPGAPPSGIGTT